MLKDFFYMDSYAAYVWSSVLLTFLVLALNWWFARRKHAALVDKLRRRTSGGAA